MLRQCYLGVNESCIFVLKTFPTSTQKMVKTALQFPSTRLLCFGILMALIAFGRVEQVAAQSLAVAESRPVVTTKPLTRKAHFRGGNAAMQAELSAFLSAQAVATDSKVLVKATVNADGQLSNISILESNSTSAADAAVKAVKGLDKWQPALTDGVPYASEIVIPIQFKVNIKPFLTDF